MPNVVTRLAPQKISLLTIPLHFKQGMPGVSGVKDAATFIRRAGGNGMDLAMFPVRNPDGTVRDFSATTLDPKLALAKPDKVSEAVAEIVKRTGIEVNAVTLCANILGNPTDREALKDVIRTAPIVGAKTVVTFIGNPFELANVVLAEDGEPTLVYGRDLKGTDLRTFFQDKLAKHYLPLEQLAKDNNVELGIEPCPMWLDMLGKGGSRQTGICNFFFAPEQRDAVMEVLKFIKTVEDLSHIRNYRDPRDGDPTATKTIDKMIARYGAHYASSIHFKDGEDDNANLPEVLGTGSAFNPNTHTLGKWIARRPFKGQINWNNAVRKFTEHSPQVEFFTFELEDLDAKNRQDNEQLFIDGVIDLRRVFTEVFGTPGESFAGQPEVDLSDINVA